MRITNVKAFQILDSRGMPTIKCTIEIDNEIYGSASVPSGSSVGEHEAVELRDGNVTIYNGKSVFSAIRNINSIIKPEILNKEFSQQDLDNFLKKLDGTPNKANLGANAILAVSLAFCVAMANSHKKPLYKYLRENVLADTENTTYSGVIPLVNVVNGGKHANNNLSFQEFLLIPLKPKTMSEAIRIVAECFEAMKVILIDKNEDTAKGDEGGYSLIKTDNPVDVCEIIKQSVERAGYEFGTDVGVGIDVAASELFCGEQYCLKGETDSLSPQKLMEIYNNLIRDYSVLSIEDPFDENDWEAFNAFNKEKGNEIQIVGDDLYCTNPILLAKGIETKATNAILIKLNQIGTLSETLDVIKLAQMNHINTIISHRSGETEDTFIADLAVATNAKQIKTGGMSRSERLAKYNRLLEIEQFENLIMPEWEELKRWE